MAKKKVRSAAWTGRPKAKQRLAVVIDAALVERAKNAVYWSPGLTLASLIEQALVVELGKLERRNGEPFPTREARLRVGRPVR